VRSRQREARSGVVEGRIAPRRRVVARGTSGRNARLGVIRIGCALIVLHVARSAIGTAQVVVVVGVALRTLQCRMCSRQGKSYERVIKARR
jgi:hypothetical protein